jgi:hypothetical protein
MPYYRIVIWTKERKVPYKGIRLIGDSNINAVQQMFQNESYQKFRDKLIDVEVQMLSKLSKAVQEFENKENFKKLIDGRK